MNKQIEKTIVDAPNYKINENGVVINKITELPITESLGVVRLTVDGKRKSFKVATLMENYFPLKKETTKEEKVTEEPKQKEPKVKTAEEKPAKTPKVKKEKPAKLPKQPKEKKAVDNGGKKDKAFYDEVRAHYDADPEAFDIMKYSKSVGVSYGRIWSIIKLHKEKLESEKVDKKAKK